MKRCDVCNGGGRLGCLSCGGAQRIPCPHHDPNMMRDGIVNPTACEECSGAGVVMCPEWDGVHPCASSCPECLGSGMVTCGECDGWRVVECQHCMHGEVVCPDCDGSHNGVACWACSGSGEVK